MNHLFLFAQASAGSDRFDSVGKTIFGVAMAGVGMIIPIALLALRKTQLGHAERMKAMELGQPPIQSQGPLALYCGMVGLGVPIGTFLITWLASKSHGTPHDIWVAPSMVSVVALIGVSIVAGIGFGRAKDLPGSQPKLKPAHDPDAVDFAGRFHRH